MSNEYAKLIWDLFAVAPSPQHRKKIAIIQAAIKVFAKDGIDRGNFERIADKCKISRPIINYYFESREDLFDKTIHYIRYHWQQFVIAEIQKAKGTAREQLRRYIFSTIDWTKKYPTYYRVQILYYFYCSHKGAFRDGNTKLVQTGASRVKSILDLGNLRKEWKIENTELASLRIHVLLTGAAISLNTENKKESYEEISKLVFEQVDLE